MRKADGRVDYIFIAGIIILPNLIMLALLIWLGVIAADSRDAASAYDRSFTQQGKCLHDTPYDPERGAQIVKTRFSSADVMVVIPQGANSYKPTVLMFGISYTLFTAPHLTPADHQTATFMVNACHVFGGGT